MDIPLNGIWHNFSVEIFIRIIKQITYIFLFCFLSVIFTAVDLFEHYYRTLESYSNILTPGSNMTHLISSVLAFFLVTFSLIFRLIFFPNLTPTRPVYIFLTHAFLSKFFVGLTKLKLCLIFE